MLVNFSTGCILSQGALGRDIPTAYASRTLREVKVQHNRALSLGSETFQTLSFRKEIHPYKRPSPLNMASFRLAHWILNLEEYNYELQYKPGKINQNAVSSIKINHLRYFSLSNLNND